MAERERSERPIRRKSRRKTCQFCVDKVTDIDYKDVAKGAPLSDGAGKNRTAPHERKLREASKAADNGD